MSPGAEAIEPGSVPAPEVTELGKLDERSAEALSSFQQADVLEGLSTVHILGPDGNVTSAPAPLGVVLVSQTCDVVISSRLAVQVARRIRLPAAEAREARAGKRPRYAHLPQLGERDFADLDIMGTVAKGQVARLTRLPGVKTDEEVRRFASAVARKFGRFAFPDNVTPWLRPLESILASKARKPTSPEGQALELVYELRVEAVNGWAEAPFELVLCVIVQPGTFPSVADDRVPDVPVSLRDWLTEPTGTLRPSSGEIAARLATSTDPAERYWLWTSLGDAWAARCRPPADAPSEVREAVSNLGADVIEADAFPLTRIRRSELLDLDHLSAPTPLL